VLTVCLPLSECVLRLAGGACARLFHRGLGGRTRGLLPFPERGWEFAMWFYGFGALVAVGLAVLFARSSIFRQLRRGHGTGRAQNARATDHALGHSDQLPRTDPAPPPQSHEQY
jgi:hypothetical protein